MNLLVSLLVCHTNTTLSTILFNFCVIMWDSLVFSNLLASHTEAGSYYSLESQTQCHKASHPVWEKKRVQRFFLFCFEQQELLHH